MQKVNRDEAIFRMYIRRHYGLYHRKAPPSLRREIQNTLGFSLFRLCVTIGVLVRTIRMELL